MSARALPSILEKRNKKISDTALIYFFYLIKSIFAVFYANISSTLSVNKIPYSISWPRSPNFQQYTAYSIHLYAVYLLLDTATAQRVNQLSLPAILKPDRKIIFTFYFLIASNLAMLRAFYRSSIKMGFAIVCNPYYLFAPQAIFLSFYQNPEAHIRPS